MLYIQNDVKSELLSLLTDAITELNIGPPSDFATDIGPVIDHGAKQSLTRYIKKAKKDFSFIGTSPCDKNLHSIGYFVAPHIFEISSIHELPGEIFGPILHVIGYDRNHIDTVIDDINACGFGLTLGIHSRIETFYEYIRQRVSVGNIYVNRSITGAVVGTQPFGGEGLSGTGFKAGGPHYLLRFCVERTYTINTAAIGGDPELLS